MKAWARFGDAGSHGGTITTAATDVRCEGVHVARVGDTYACPTHGPNPIVGPGSAKYRIEGAMLARHGDATACGATIVASAIRTFDDD